MENPKIKRHRFGFEVYEEVDGKVSIIAMRTKLAVTVDEASEMIKAEFSKSRAGRIIPVFTH